MDIRTSFILLKTLRQLGQASTYHLARKSRLHYAITHKYVHFLRNLGLIETTIKQDPHRVAHIHKITEKGLQFIELLRDNLDTARHND